MSSEHSNLATAISVHNMNKSFKLPIERANSIKTLIVSGFKGSQYRKFNVLQNISFEIQQGEFFGIVGRNGSGKSTLLKLLAGIYSSDKGTINITGRLTPFIELGVGFNPELTGKENVFLNGALLGFSRKEMNAIYDEIVAFSELEDFMDQKLKNYSSGMQVRLAFSIAIRAESDILLIDEVLAVGDAVFQKKCFNYFKELKQRNRTVVFISHDVSSLLEFCDRGILIENGRIQSAGDINDVVNDYIDSLNKANEKKRLDSSQVSTEEKRWGVGGIEVVNAATLDAKTHRKRALFTEKDKELRIKVSYESQDDYEMPIYGITITDASGVNILTSNTHWQKIKTKSVTTGSKVQVEWTLPNLFSNGKYYVAPAVADKYGSTIYDWRDNFLSFEVNKIANSTAIINIDHNIQVIQ